MGFNAQQINEMSMWQFYASVHGYIDANSPKGKATLTDAVADDLFEWINQGSSGPQTLSTQTYWWEGELPEPAGVVTFTV